MSYWNQITSMYPICLVTWPKHHDSSSSVWNLHGNLNAILKSLKYLRYYGTSRMNSLVSTQGSRQKSSQYMQTLLWPISSQGMRLKSTLDWINVVSYTARLTAYSGNITKNLQH